jgi:hypothetical protein
MNIQKNILQKNIFNEIKNLFFNSYFGWYYQNCVNDENDNHLQFCHTFFDNNKINSDYFVNISPIIDFINPEKLIRVKANLLPKTEKIIEHGFHTDFKDCMTSVYYINTNNGYTKLIDETIITSEENKLVTFDSNTKHTGSTCTDENVRIVLNINYLPKI